MTTPPDRLPTGVRLVGLLGHPQSDREVWQAEMGDGTTVAAKLVKNSWALERLPWLTATIDRLHTSGYPVPRMVWHAALEDGWFVMVQAWAPGAPPRSWMPPCWTDCSN
jgi:hypothetical protein